MRKISYKIALVCIICTLVSGLSIGILSSNYASEIIKKQAEDNLSNQAEIQADKIKNVTTGVEALVNDLNSLVAEKANNCDLDNNMKGFLDQVNPLLLNFADNINSNVDIYATLDQKYAINGKIINQVYFKQNGKFELTDAPITVNDLKTTPGNYAWYLEPMVQKKGLWSDVYYDSNLKLWMISYTAPIVTNKGIIGIVGLDIDFDTLKSIVNKAKLYNTGYVSMVDKKKNIVAHPKFKSEDNLNTVANGTLKILSDAIDKGTRSAVHYKLDNKEKIAAFVPVGETFTVIATVSKEDVMSILGKLQRTEMVVTIISIIILAFFGFLGGMLVSNPVKQVSMTVEKIGNGDLTSKVAVKTKDEIGQLAQSVNNTIDGVKRLVSGVKNSSGKIISDMHKIHEVTNTVSDSNLSITSKINDLAKATSEQAASTQKASFKLMDMVNSVNEVKSSVEQMNGLISETLTVMNDSKKVIDKQKNEITKSMLSTNEVFKAMNDLSEKSKEIGTILQMISGISEQTNMLSLNAAIEAARAGEQGKGFAVVASEIRKLAEQSNGSVNQISNIIQDIKMSIETASEEMKKENDSQQESVKMITETVTSLDKFGRAFGAFEKEIFRVSNAVKQLVENALVASDSLTNIAGITQETAAYSEEVVSSVEFQNSIIDDIVETARELRVMSEDLAKSIGSFKV